MNDGFWIVVSLVMGVYFLFCFFLYYKEFSMKIVFIIGCLFGFGFEIVLYFL